MAGFQDLLRRNSGEPLPYHEHDGGDITGVIGSARIINATIDSLSITKITGGTYIDTDLTFASGSDLVASNYSPGVSGWKIGGDGTAEFRDVTVDGIVITGAGSNVDWGHVTSVAIVNANIVNLSASKINAGSMSSTYLTVDTEIVVASGGRISIGGSMKFGDNAGGAGWDGLYLNSTNYWRTTGIWAIGTASKGVTWDNTTFKLQDMDITGTLNLNDVSAGINWAGGSVRMQHTSWPTPTAVGIRDVDNGLYLAIFQSIGTSSIIQFGTELEGKFGSASKPGYTFFTDTDTGMYRYAANKVGISTGGVVGLRIEAAGIVTEAASYGTGTRNVFAFSWSSPNMYAQVDAAVEAVIGTVSDRRLKGDIKPLTDGLSRVLALSPVTYKPIAIGKTNGSGPRRAGLIADEVEKVEKWAVVGKATKDSYQSVSYQELTPLLIGAIKDLSTRVAVLEAV